MKGDWMELDTLLPPLAINSEFKTPSGDDQV